MRRAWFLTMICCAAALVAGASAALPDQPIDLVTGEPIAQPAEPTNEEECKEIQRRCGFDDTISGLGAKIVSPKNTGACKITLTCVDAMGAVVGSPLVLGEGEAGVEFGCTDTTSINMKCDKEPNSKWCKLTYKDPPVAAEPTSEEEP